MTIYNAHETERQIYKQTDKVADGQNQKAGYTDKQTNDMSDNDT